MIDRLGMLLCEASTLFEGVVLLVMFKVIERKRKQR